MQKFTWAGVEYEVDMEAAGEGSGLIQLPDGTLLQGVWLWEGEKSVVRLHKVATTQARTIEKPLEIGEKVAYRGYEITSQGNWCEAWFNGAIQTQPNLAAMKATIDVHLDY